MDNKAANLWSKNIFTRDDYLKRDRTANRWPVQDYLEDPGSDRSVTTGQAEGRVRSHIDRFLKISISKVQRIFA